jgi:hypothetical protein
MPTASPTPSNYAVAYFNVSQVLANITVAQFDTYNAIAAFVTAVVGSSDGTVPTSAQVYVRDTTTILTNLRTEAASTQTSSILVFYSIYFYVDNDSNGALNTAYRSVTDQLTNAIATGTFQSLMVVAAAATHASGLYYSQAADAPTYYDYAVVSSHSTSSGSKSTLGGGAIAALVITSIIVVVAVYFGLYYYMKIQVHKSVSQPAGSNAANAGGASAAQGAAVEMTHTAAPAGAMTTNPMNKSGTAAVGDSGARVVTL